MENTTMNPMTSVSNWRGLMPSAVCAASQSALATAQVQGVLVRPNAVRAAAVTTALKAAYLAVERDRAIATGITGHAAGFAGTRPGSSAWSPPR